MEQLSRTLPLEGTPWGSTVETRPKQKIQLCWLCSKMLTVIERFGCSAHCAERVHVNTGFDSDQFRLCVC